MDGRAIIMLLMARFIRALVFGRRFFESNTLHDENTRNTKYPSP